MTDCSGSTGTKPCSDWYDSGLLVVLMCNCSFSEIFCRKKPKGWQIASETWSGDGSLPMKCNAGSQTWHKIRSEHARLNLEERNGHRIHHARLKVENEKELQNVAQFDDFMVLSKTLDKQQPISKSCIGTETITNGCFRTIITWEKRRGCNEDD